MESEAGAIRQSVGITIKDVIITAALVGAIVTVVRWGTRLETSIDALNQTTSELKVVIKGIADEHGKIQDDLKDLQRINGLRGFQGDQTRARP